MQKSVLASLSDMDLVAAAADLAQWPPGKGRLLQKRRCKWEKAVDVLGGTK